ncbi:MAG: UDP-N-acetylglucosamine diphosphorylase/glucosamine-1-phosphate N-acetyltransferase [Deltaproteobacteria bacterium]|nr:UDP-N-acetylglucosamine diphosphorylase/glucosamine-1-phosphate N-acetyltransferase [Deltaproteobacteria bacterium]MBU47691.1 UDP-N-acetylglucosamine diphosphorylase/glucosamine-1-phosphate N-acetyltransferase [Deltaproteobacteria bacterium]|tara:strand:- start:15198 stop:16181 length:984 start_codon:yes stop_codon:yes gene_type:complete
MASDLSVVILAAGKGTRMRSPKAKVLHTIGGIPIVAHIIHTVQTLSPERTVVVVGHQADEVEQTLSARFGKDKLDFALQAQQLGTGHAVMEAQSSWEQGGASTLILSGDVPLLQAETLQGLHNHREQHNAAVAVLSFSVDDPTGYGRIVRDQDGQFLQIREHRDCSDEQREIKECNSGIYLVDRDFLKGALGQLKTDNDQNEYYLTDIVEIAMKEGKTVTAHCVDDAGEVLGINDRAQLAALEQTWQQKRNEYWMREGCTLRLPQTIQIDYDVKLGHNTEISPNCCLLGNTTIGENCKIGAGSVLKDTIVKDNMMLPPHSVFTDTKV